MPSFSSALKYDGRIQLKHPHLQWDKIGKERGGRGLCVHRTAPTLSNHDHLNLNSSFPHTVPPKGGDEVVTEWMGLDSLSSIHAYIIWRGSAALYLPSSGLMACGLMGPVRMGLAVETGGLSGSGRSPPAWWFGAEPSCGGFPPWSSLDTLLACVALSCCCCCCCSEKNLWVDWSTSARCFAYRVME